MSGPVDQGESAWIEAHYDELRNQYPGQWIAVVGERVMWHGADLADMPEIDDPFLEYLPGPEDDGDVVIVAGMGRG